MTAPPSLEVQEAREAFVDDAALESLMCNVYVNEGFTSPDVAATVLTAAAIRQRGKLLFVRDFADETLLGTVIVVAPGSPACRVARDGEVEMQLLAVSAERRNGGVGGALVEAAVSRGPEFVIPDGTHTSTRRRFVEPGARSLKPKA